jgi:hypothetical protein
MNLGTSTLIKGQIVMPVYYGAPLSSLQVTKLLHFLSLLTLELFVFVNTP